MYGVRPFGTDLKVVGIATVSAEAEDVVPLHMIMDSMCQT